MASGTKTAGIAIGALFIGALVGGVLGTALGRPVIDSLTGASAPVQSPPPGGRAEGAARPGSLGAGGDGAASLLALGDLTAEVRGMREDLNDEPSRRTSPEGGTPELERLAELLDLLASNLKNSPRAGTSPGYQGAPLVTRAGEPNRNRLADLADTPEEERSAPIRFLTYQQVLDRFGTPDQVSNEGVWMFEDPLSRVELYFFFKDGLLMNVY